MTWPYSLHMSQAAHYFVLKCKTMQFKIIGGTTRGSWGFTWPRRVISRLIPHQFKARFDTRLSVPKEESAMLIFFTLKSYWGMCSTVHPVQIQCEEGAHRSGTTEALQVIIIYAIRVKKNRRFFLALWFLVRKRQRVHSICRTLSIQILLLNKS